MQTLILVNFLKCSIQEMITFSIPPAFLEQMAGLTPGLLWTPGNDSEKFILNRGVKWFQMTLRNMAGIIVWIWDCSEVLSIKFAAMCIHWLIIVTIMQQSRILTENTVLLLLSFYGRVLSVQRLNFWNL